MNIHIHMYVYARTELIASRGRENTELLFVNYVNKYKFKCI